jgi:phospholipase C
MTSKLLGCITLAVLLGSSTVTAGSLKDIEHVVIFMQENRSWDSVCFLGHSELVHCTHRLAVLWYDGWSPWL